MSIGNIHTQNVPTSVNGPKFATFCHFLTYFDFAATFRKLISGLKMLLKESMTGTFSFGKFHGARHYFSRH